MTAPHSSLSSPAPMPAAVGSDPVPASIAVIGTGYVGLTAAVCFAHLGHQVTAVDIDEAKVDELRRGQSTIVERDLDRLLTAGLASGRLTFTTDPAATSQAGVVLLCLPTPHQPDGGLDLRFVEAAARTLRNHLRPGAVVVTKSTVPVGTHRKLAGWLDRDDLHVVSNPEFLREGSAIDDFLRPDRVVIGAGHPEAGARVAALYAPIDAPVHHTDPATAELIKYAANTFLAAKLSFVNEMSRLAEAVGADIDQVCAGIAADHRIGGAFLRPGPGWGGSCFPKDTRGLTHLAAEAGLTLPVAEAAYASNRQHLDHITQRIVEACPVPVSRARIAVWGATFKAGTDDVRDSPAIEIITRLQAAGATVTVHDPAARADTVPAPLVDDPYSACTNADLLAVLTEWPDLADADLTKVADLMRGTVVYDTRGLLPTEALTAAGLTVHRPGRPTGA